MTANAATINGRILLVSAPWPLFNRPSLPLGVLKAYLKQELPHVEVAASHCFLEMARVLGYERYHFISRRVWRAEAVFAALLHPDRFHEAASVYHRTGRRRNKRNNDFSKVVDKVKAISEAWLARIDWASIDVVGFSISFCQVTASLYLISAIKAIRPDLPVVVGGSSFSTHRAKAVMAVFPQIDYLIIGEGERPLVALIARLLAARSSPPAARLPDGIVHGTLPLSDRRMSQLRRLDRLPIPDYRDYFDQIAAFAPADRFFPTLPVEASRGCWWHRSDPGGHFRGCAFCNLNLQWNGYRTKPAQRVVSEVNELVERYQTTSIAFSDNAMTNDHAAAVFDGIRHLDKDLSIFVELRASAPASLIRGMAQAGVDTVQIGIEALSSTLLEKMNKGVKTIDNLCVMKRCEVAGIANAANLMLHFPSSDAADVDDTLRSLAFARWYRPLKTVRFWLGLDSPVYRHAGRFGIRAVFNHPNLKRLMPRHVADAFAFMIQGYRGDRMRQMRLWRPVEKAVRQWQRDYDALMRQTNGRPALTYRDAGRFLIIDQHLPGESTARHRLTGASADIYRACDRPLTLDQLAERIPGHRREQIQRFCRTMVDKHLMFAEADRYLSLAPRRTRQAS